MRVAILGASVGWQTDELCRALNERGHAGFVVPYEGLVARLGTGSASGDAATQGGESCREHHDSRGHGDLTPSASDALLSECASILDADAVLARIIPAGSLEQIIFRVDALHWIEDRGIPVMNSPRTIERCVDKFYTDALLREAGLPVPETVVCERADEALAAIREMGDVVVKPIFGSLGHGIVRVSDTDLAHRVVETLEQLRAVFYVQRAVDHGGRDIRVFVVGGRVLGAIERMAPPGEWRTNVSRGGTVRPVDLPPAWEQYALRAASVVGADYAGVDLLPSTDGAVFVLEVNGIPGWKGLQQATGLDVAGALVNHLAHKVAAKEAAGPSASLRAGAVVSAAGLPL